MRIWRPGRRNGLRGYIRLTFFCDSVAAMPEGFVPVSASRVAVAGIFSRPDPPGRNCCRDSIVPQNPG